MNITGTNLSEWKNKNKYLYKNVILWLYHQNDSIKYFLDLKFSILEKI